LPGLLSWLFPLCDAGVREIEFFLPALLDGHMNYGDRKEERKVVYRIQ